ncbi:MAG: 2-dehydropantoate 2-reductase [Bacteroidetes bacterium GWF2_33_16]|nr:MAG: 2-dehydropantoate 2-reductase [Bacteroidetes bacterium GWE2_32_14]OFY03064.1 MAG: 2-dehydropantoate 2-reductase [Bacteroidetes bacterium GWF2_33_16]
MKIAIIGTGGVGGYFGGKLAKAGYDVTFLARGKHLRAIQQNGLIVKSVLGDFKVDSMKATDRIETIGFSDLIIITVKAWQIKDITKDLKTIIKNDTIVLPLQNGVLAAEELKENIKQENIIGGLCRIISKIESPGVINHFGIEPTILFGELDNSKTERILKIKAIFDNAGINAKISDDIVVDLWKKFIPICVSGLLAITNTTYGELRELSETRQLMIELLNEIFRLSQKIGIKIESAYLDKAITFIDSFPYDSTSSLTRDVWEGKPSEIEYQNGTVVRLGEKFGVDTPINRFVYNCILPMEIKARKL